MQQRQSTIVAALVGAALATFIVPRAELPRAYADTAGGGSDMFAVVAPGVVQGSSSVFVIDPRSAHLLVFEYRPGARLELTAGRDLQWDLQLPQFPTNAAKAPVPLIKDVEAAVRELQAQPPTGGGQGGG
jgi:hypothetical protein